MSVLSDMFGEGSTAEQFFTWSVLARLVDTLLGPMWTEVGKAINATFPEVPLSPALLADLVVRSYLTQEEGAKQASMSGVSAGDFKLMVDDTGEPPPLQMLLEAYRRGLINLDTVSELGPPLIQGIHESRLRNEWITLIDAMKTGILSPADWVAAVVRNQVSKADGEAGAFKAGIATDDFDVLVNTTGNPPSPGELVDFVRRGLIPMGDTDPATLAADPTALTFAQGILEGDSKDKWLPLYAQLVPYIPPPRSAVAVYRAGGYTPAELQAILEKNGLSTADAQAYVVGASGDKLAGTVQLAVGAIDSLYYDQAVNSVDATTMLENIGYSPAEAAFELAIVDFRREQAAVTSAVSRISTLYIGHKIDVTTARAALGRLNIPGTQQDQLIQTWTVEAGANIKLLTETQIVDAWAEGILTQDQAQSELEGIGYQPTDAWTLLSIKNKGPLPNKPAAGPTPLYAAPPPPPTGA